MADTKEAAFKAVQVEALVVMKVARHASQAFPTTATGCLVGMEADSILEVTNTFAFPIFEVPGQDASSAPHHHHHQPDPSALASMAPRQKPNAAYQAEMIRHLKEVNVDANSVGWYTSASMGNFLNLSFVENQYHYQKDNERAVALVHDVSRSAQGALNLRAFKLSPGFMAAFKEGKFTTEVYVSSHFLPTLDESPQILISTNNSLRSAKLSFKDVLVEYPVTIHNSHLLTTYLHQIPPPPTRALDEPPLSLDDLTSDPVAPPLHPSLDALDLSIDPYLEKTCDLLLESVEAHYTDLNNFQFYQRQLGREQTKIAGWQAKRKAENAARQAAKQPLLPEDEWSRLFKLPQEPNRLEGVLNAGQAGLYAKQVDGFTANVSAKMFAVRENLLPK